MKKLLTFLLLVTTLNNFAQITLENTYPPNVIPTGYGFPRLVKLSSSGYKYAIYDTASVTLFNLNHTVFKNMVIPPRPVPLLNTQQIHVYYISEELFNTTPTDVEYFVYYADKNFIGHSIVYDESGNVLFSKDTTNMSLVLTQTFGYEDFISFTTSGCKMIIYVGNNLTGSVYSLPGTLPCHDCTNGTTTSIMTNNTGANTEKISNYPNPTAGQTTVEYNLPQGVTTADLVFYNMTGQEVKRFKVTNTFHDILISTADLDAGSYYYCLQTSNGFSAGKKMVVIK
jgi:hypothetical protein